MPCSSRIGNLPSAVLLLCLAAPAWGQEEACLGCHDNKGMAAQAPQVAASRFASSAHKDLGCAGCHQGKDEVPHPKKAPAVSCAGCHEDSSKAVRASDHGRMLLQTRKGAALCLACHGSPHELRKTADPASAVSRARIPETCDSCHKKMDFKGKFGVEPFTSYAQTVHGKAHLAGHNGKAAVCTDCHGSHSLDFSSDSRSRANRNNIPKTCGRCHPGPLALYTRSIHGRKAAARVKDAPVCTDCHGEHNIKDLREPGSMVYTGSIVKTCSACHGSEKLIAKFGMPLDPAKAYRDGYHGVAFTAGNLAAANCASCHHHHDILPSEDPKSSVHPGNLQKTCGACHPRAGDLVGMGKVHTAITEAARDLPETIMRLVRQGYILLIVLTIGGMLAHNFLDHKRKLLLGPSHHAHDLQSLRLSVNERVQHLFLLVSFIGLAYTGFCHTYPESVFSRYVFTGATGAHWRSGLHRVFALVLMLLACYHMAWLAGAKEGRGEFKDMFPRWQDVPDVLQLQRYNLTHRGEPPKFGRFNYMEKAEYWALVWGTGVMVVTGCVAWFRDISLHVLPKWCIDLCLLIHFMEAVLACLAILVWHSYWTVFDVDVYPMNWAWITGKFKLPSAQVRDDEQPS
ncbi:MAG: cytochrome b/b6 domain-containing protein [Elusimicrobia bacterium]|nr:cytochrome b/b6 domain-containing protein [Elusimicrobiota bacterium]